MTPTRSVRSLILPLIAAIGIALGQSASTAPVQVRFGPNILLSSGQPSSQWEVEPTIAASPKNPKNLVAAHFGRDSAQTSDVCHTNFTIDGGITWKDGGRPPAGTSLNSCFDPALAADAAGNFYFSYLDVTPVGSITTADLRVAKSTDGGRSFATSSLAVVGGTAIGTPDPDKPYIAVDAQPKSRFKGTIYLSYTDLPAFDFIINVTVSRDGGATWSTPTTISRPVDAFSNGSVGGSLPVVAPDGTAYIFYQDSSHVTQRTSIKYVRSKDGGSSWSAPADVAADLPSPGFYLLDNGSAKFGVDSVGILATSYPTAAIAPDGTIYVAWTDFSSGRCTAITDSLGFIDNPCVNADVRLSFSRDGGRTWSAPIKVSDDATSADQFLPWIAVQPSGLLSLIWLDRRLDPKLLDYDLFYTNTRDGQTFLPNLRVSTESSKVDATYLGGDYNTLAATSDGIVPVWNDSRSNTVQIYAARGTVAP